MAVYTKKYYEIDQKLKILFQMTEIHVFGFGGKFSIVYTDMEECVL